MSKIVNVGEEFYHRLANRDKRQGDGKHTAIEFRSRYLQKYDTPEFWLSPEKLVTLDFSQVKKISPSFANEAFAYFTIYAKPEAVIKFIQFINITSVQREIIEAEIREGYGAKWG